MQYLEVSCAVRPTEWPLGVKWLTATRTSMKPTTWFFLSSYHLGFLL